MRFTISRSSDYFMSSTTPTKNWTPHKKAIWNEDKNHWYVDLTNIKDLTGLATEKERIVVTYRAPFPHVEIDDLTEQY